MKVVIVGGGFGGLEVAKGLGGHESFEVLLLDRRNYHLFQPLLYQVAMAGLSPAEIAVPIRSLLSQYKNTRVLLANVQGLSLKDQQVHTDIGDFSYDRLVLACGAKHSYFGKEQWEPLAPGLKTLEQATEIRRRVLTAFEMAEREPDPELRKQWMTFVVVGGGPTGVELAGAIGEISRFTLSRDFRKIQSERARVILLEGGPRILASFHPSLSNSACRSLESLGVQVWVDSRVTLVSEEGVSIGGEWIKSHTVLWAAGVQASSLNRDLCDEVDRQGRVSVNPDLSLPNHPEVFVIGDQAACRDNEGSLLPGLAPVAMQQGRYVAGTLKAQLKGKPIGDFRYKDKGQMATIGRRSAVLEFGPLRLKGFLAWMAWLLVHIYYLIGFKNRLFVFLQWAWHYLCYGRGARLIVHKKWRSYPPKKVSPTKD